MLLFIFFLYSIIFITFTKQMNYGSLQIQMLLLPRFIYGTGTININFFQLLRSSLLVYTCACTHKTQILRMRCLIDKTYY